LDHTRPIVLCIGGHDPTGGAGLQADIETVNAVGGRAVTLVSCLTAQDTGNVAALWQNPVEQLRVQADTLLADIRPDAVKIGLLGSPEAAAMVAERVGGMDLPVVLDPVLAAGGGRPLAAESLVAVLRSKLLPHCTLLTPNRAEATRLGGHERCDDAVAALLKAGAGAVLVTGADSAAERADDVVINRLYRDDAAPRHWTWPRLAATYHGSGCTLASACATLIALGTPIESAVEQAQAFTWKALRAAEAPGQGQPLPGRWS
jgi:hydroxymethylpyrimidine/phosphomethylpyrimidine kinase